MNNNKNKSGSGGDGGGSTKFWTKMKDVAAKTQTAGKNTKETISIQKKQLMISERKKNFGVEYLDLVEEGASQAQLQECVDRALADVATMRGKVAKYKDRIAINEAKLDSKLSTTPQYTEPTINITQTNSNNSSSQEEDEQHRPPPPRSPTYHNTTVHAHPAPSAPFATASAQSSNPFDDDVVENNNIQSIPTRSTNPTATRPTTSRNRGTNPFGDDDHNDEPENIVPPPAAAAAAAAASAIPVQNGSTNPFEDDNAVDVPMAQAKIF